MSSRGTLSRPKLFCRHRSSPSTRVPSAGVQPSRAVVNTPRLVVADCERFGIHFKTGDMVLTLLPMAGRDDRVNDDPARFDMDREHASHLCFSTGPHLCIGHNLARMELKILMEEWTKRIPKFRAAPGQAHGFRAGTVMALLSLPLEWTPG